MVVSIPISALCLQFSSAGGDPFIAARPGLVLQSELFGQHAPLHQIEEVAWQIGSGEIREVVKGCRACSSYTPGDPLIVLDESGVCAQNKY